MNFFKKPPPKFEVALYKFIQAGFLINPDVQESEIKKRWNEVLEYHRDPVDAMYIALGGETDQKPILNFSDNCWHFDLEAIEFEGSYIRILENISRISHGDLNFQEITDYCNDDEDDKAWVNFEFEGEKYHWDLKVYKDWADGDLFDKIQGLCKKYNRKGKLTFFPQGQAFVTSYLSEDEFEKIKRITGVKLKWLSGKGQIY